MQTIQKKEFRFASLGYLCICNQHNYVIFNFPRYEEPSVIKMYLKIMAAIICLITSSISFGEKKFIFPMIWRRAQERERWFERKILRQKKTSFFISKAKVISDSILQQFATHKNFRCSEKRTRDWSPGGGRVNGILGYRMLGRFQVKLKVALHLTFIFDTSFLSTLTKMLHT